MSAEDSVRYYVNLVIGYFFDLIDVMLDTVATVFGWFGLAFSADARIMATYVIAFLVAAAVFSKVLSLFKHWIYNTLTGLIALVILSELGLGIPLTPFTLVIAAVFGVAGVLALVVLSIGGVFM